MDGGSAIANLDDMMTIMMKSIADFHMAADLSPEAHLRLGVRALLGSRCVELSNNRLEPTC